MKSPDGFARPPARIEIAQADGTTGAFWCSPPGSRPSRQTARRSHSCVSDRGSSMLALSSADGSERVLVDPGRFPEIFSPRYSPDGTRIAFGARAYADLQPMTTNGLAGLLSLVGPTTAYAHGSLADLWVINADS